MDRNKLIEKIKKCMALGKSSNANEAAAALRQAQKMMDALGITEAEVMAQGYGTESVEVPIQVNKKKTPIALLYMIELIEKAFKVKGIVSATLRVSDYSYTVRYFGQVGRVATACYAHTVIHRAMEAGWRDYLAANPDARGQRGARMGFQIMFIITITEKVEEIGFTDEEEAIVQALINSTFKNLVTIKSKPEKIDPDAGFAGILAGAAFQINRPVGEQHVALSQF